MRSVICLLLLATAVVVPAAAQEESSKALVQVVTTLPDYAWAAVQIGGDRVEVHSIARGNQDAHYVRPRPSYQAMISAADLLVTTGLDLEIWLPTLLDAAGNRQVLDGSPGYVAAWPGIEMLGIPSTADRSRGDIHLYGNPHIHTDPLNMVLIGRNILAGLKRVDPDHATGHEERAEVFEDRLYRRLFGDDLVDLIGGKALARLARSGKLFSFLEDKEFPRGSGRFLQERLGGWLRQAEPLRGAEIIAYHQNWIYFTRRFGIKVAGYMETKPGIPPTPRHVQEIMELIQRRDIRVILSANYFDPSKPQAIAERTGRYRRDRSPVHRRRRGQGGLRGSDRYVDRGLAGGTGAAVRPGRL